jgi:hypothetical protein
MVYGSDECLARNLRENNGAGARLRVFGHSQTRRNGQFKAFLPRTLEQPECFAPSGECFLAGDLRVNEQPGLTCLHTVLLREDGQALKDTVESLNVRQRSVVNVRYLVLVLYEVVYFPASIYVEKNVRIGKVCTLNKKGGRFIFICKKAVILEKSTSTNFKIS